MGRAFSKTRIIGIREECRIREQDFGNFQVEERMRDVKETRQRFGCFSIGFLKANQLPSSTIEFPPGSCSYLSYTAARDRLYQYSFSLSGLKSTITDLGEGTRGHCWLPKKPIPSKPNLLLIHGFGANAMWQWDPFLPQLGPHFNLYIPDLLFFGASSTLSPLKSESFQAQTLMTLIDLGFRVKKMSLAGISYGGFVGYNLAAQFPQAVDKVVL